MSGCPKHTLLTTNLPLTGQKASFPLLFFETHSSCGLQNGGWEIAYAYWVLFKGSRNEAEALNNFPCGKIEVAGKEIQPWKP